MDRGWMGIGWHNPDFVLGLLESRAQAIDFRIAVKRPCISMSCCFSGSRLDVQSILLRSKLRRRNYALPLGQTTTSTSLSNPSTFVHPPESEFGVGGDYET